MSDKTIKVGDLVMVVRLGLCCPDASVMGKIFKVSELIYFDSIPCGICGIPRVGLVIGAFGSGLESSISTRRLIKIDPPSIPESIERTEEVPA